MTVAVQQPQPPKGFRDSMERLTRAQKSNKGAPLYSVLINRPMGRAFAAAFHQIGVTPNQVTGISAVFTFSGIIATALWRPSWPMAVVVGLCLVLGYGLDAADGQLSRLRGTSSMLGEWLDHVIDSFKIATLHLAVLVMAFRQWHMDAWLWVPLGFAAVYVIHFFGMLLTDLLAREFRAGRGEKKTATGIASPLMSLAKLPTDYGFLALTFFTLGAPEVFRAVYTVMFACTAAYTALVLPRWARQIAALDRLAVAGTAEGDA